MKYYWEYATYKEVKDMDSMRAIFDGYARAYYRITQPKNFGGGYRISARYERDTEKIAYHNLHKRDKKFGNIPLEMLFRPHSMKIGGEK